MYRNQFRSDRLNDHATTARSGRPGSVQQQYRPRSPAGLPTQGNATSYAPAGSAGAAAAGHTEPANLAPFGSLDNVKPSNVPAQSDVLSSVSAEGTWSADSLTQAVPTKGHSPPAFTLQFGTFRPGVISNQHSTICTSSAPPDLNGNKHEKALRRLSDKPNTVSLSVQEPQKQEATDDLVIGGGTDILEKYENVCVPELHETPMLNSVPPTKKVCMDSCKVPRTLSSPTQQQCQNQETKDTVNANQSDTAYKYPATKPKISVQIPASYTPNMAPPQFMLPVPGRSMPVAFQQKQPQVPVEFRGPGFQMQSIGSVSSSLPVKMAVPVGNAPHIQPMFVHGAQPRALHQQTFMHQGQGFRCAPPANCHVPQFGNMRFAQELSQQHPRSGDEQKRTVKITHPETHEELMLDRRGYSFMGAPVSGQMPLHNINQLPQPVQTFSPLQKVYYPRPATYNSAPIYLPNATTVPLASRQISSKMQPPMHSFDSTNSNQPVTSIRPPMPISWVDASSRALTDLHTASEVSNFKGLLPSSLSAPVDVEVKPPITFHAEKNEVSLKCSGEFSMSNQQSNHKIRVEISHKPAILVSDEENLKVPAATSNISCNSVSQAVPNQQTQTRQASVDHATPIVGPRTISTSNLPSASTASCTSSVKAKPSDMEEPSVIPTTSSSHSKLESSHTEASGRTDSVIWAATSLISNIDETSPTNRNPKYDGDSILGKPPLIYAQEMAPPKFAGSNTFIEGLRKAKVNPVPFVEKSSELVGSVPLQNQDFMVKEHAVNEKGMCSKSKAEQVDVTRPGTAFGLEDGTGVAKSGRFHACHESADLHPSISIDIQTSNENQQPSPDAEIVTSQSENKQNDSRIDSARDVKNAAPVSNSTSSQRKIGQERIDSEISNPCSMAAASVVQTKKVVLESIKAKSTNGRRKKRREMVPKASGQKYYVLDSASSSLNDNVERFNTSEDVQSSLTTDLKRNCTLGTEKDSSTGGNDSQNRTDLFDWEDATENSAEKLKALGYMHCNIGEEVNKDKCEFDHKRYSRDFLLTFAQNCIELPAGFKIGFDISEAVMNVYIDASFIGNTELNPNQARIKDRGLATSRANRHMSSKFDDDKWRKQFSSHVSGRKSLSDNVHQPAFSSWDAVQRVGHGSTRILSQSEPFSQYSGEMLSRAMKEVVSQRSMSRGSVDERWQHRNNPQGISSPSQISMPLIHKAEKKYEIGKVSDEEEAKQRQLKAILNKLTPQNFEKLFAQVKELNIDNVVTLTGVISQIFDKALMEPTFCEMYASFCFRLAGDLPNFVKDDEKITFKRLLLNKCQEEFERGEREQAEADKAEEEGGTKQSEVEREEKRIRARRRMLGNIRLIGELYKKKMLTERIMHECINKLLGEYQNPDGEDLEALCKLMSTIGEMIDHPRAKVHMDFYFDLIQKLSENSKLSSRIRFMLEDVIDLRRNKWRQRRKVEGPKKIDEVRRDAVKQKLGQSTRFGPSNYNSSVTCISSGLRPGPLENSTRGSSALASRGSSQVRTYGSQNVNLDARYQPLNRPLPVPLHQRCSDKSIRLGPQGDLGRGMSLCGKPHVPNEIFPEIPLNSHHGQTSKNSREGSVTGAASNRTNFKASNTSWGTADHASPLLSTVGQTHTSSTVRKEMCAEAQTLPEEVLQEKSILTIKEFYRQAPIWHALFICCKCYICLRFSFFKKYMLIVSGCHNLIIITLTLYLPCSAKDEEEVALCMKELNAPSFYPSLVSLWINDSFERKDLERELLAKLLVFLCKSQENLLSQRQLVQGFQHVLSTLEDAVTDAPKATKFLGQILAKVIMEDVISLTEIGGLLQEQDGREERAGRHALHDSLASEVLGSMLESIRVERGDSAVDEIRAKSNLQRSSRPGVCV
ncbi:Eukaryotic translation initiation factor 4G [Dichanthelium oligosanthes]|uniref:Eukaryotic translation initiation factor 4G n=1 Tax=Dichanthelium oligosanthes TaxID=888268 RepID=A0A1E5V1T7_9POAL|nr:Eukaryotic translation initiation factor 4G [Dichanthelium oligosanthes]